MNHHLAAPNHNAPGTGEVAFLYLPRDLHADGDAMNAVAVGKTHRSTAFIERSGTDLKEGAIRTRL